MISWLNQFQKDMIFSTWLIKLVTDEIQFVKERWWRIFTMCSPRGQYERKSRGELSVLTTCVTTRNKSSLFQLCKEGSPVDKHTSVGRVLNPTHKNCRMWMKSNTVLSKLVKSRLETRLRDYMTCCCVCKIQNSVDNDSSISALNMNAMEEGSSPKTSVRISECVSSGTSYTNQSIRTSENSSDSDTIDQLERMIIEVGWHEQWTSDWFITEEISEIADLAQQTWTLTFHWYTLGCYDHSEIGSYARSTVFLRRSFWSWVCVKTGVCVPKFHQNASQGVSEHYQFWKRAEQDQWWSKYWAMGIERWSNLLCLLQFDHDRYVRVDTFGSESSCSRRNQLKFNKTIFHEYLPKSSRWYKGSKMMVKVIWELDATNEVLEYVKVFDCGACERLKLHRLCVSGNPRSRTCILWSWISSMKLQGLMWYPFSRLETVDIFCTRMENW